MMKQYVASLRLRRGILLFGFLALVSPTIINYRPYPLGWDEAYYLNRIICTNQAVYHLSLSRLDDCLAHTHKGPVMQVINVPWGKAGGTERGIGLAFVGLALFIWTFILITYCTCLRGGIHPALLLLAAATICLSRFLRASAGAMMTDMLLGWCVALALMLIPLEYRTPSRGFWSSFARGLFWGLVIDAGILNKVTFGFFLVIVGMSLLTVRQDHSGQRPVLYAAAGCVIGAMPAIVIWRYYGLNFLRFAVMAAWGQYALFWDVRGMTPANYLQRYVSQLGLAVIPLGILMVLFVRGLVVEKERRLGRLLPIAIILMYLALAARSHNRDPRFGIPVMIAMPICLAWTSDRQQSAQRVGPAPIITALLLGVALFLPMIRRPELGPIRQVGHLLKTLSRDNESKDGRVRVVIATDGPAFNVDTFLLAKQVDWNNLRNIDIDTLVYDAINNHTLDEGFKRIDTANYVLFLRPGVTPGADWSRVHASSYRQYCEKVAILQDSNLSAEFDVFKVRTPRGPETPGK
jgi:hypothetical protein